jgi:hypothetical protein
MTDLTPEQRAANAAAYTTAWASMPASFRARAGQEGGLDDAGEPRDELPSDPAFVAVLNAILASPGLTVESAKAAMEALAA